MADDRRAALRAWALDRARERSTVIGLVVAGGTLGGLAIAPEKLDAIATIVSLVASVVAILVPERPK